MGNLYDYFAAADDDTAGAALGQSPDPERFDVLDVAGIEPAVQLGTLEALLRGVDYELVAADPRQCALVGDAREQRPSPLLLDIAVTWPARDRCGPGRGWVDQNSLSWAGCLRLRRVR